MAATIRRRAADQCLPMEWTEEFAKDGLDQKAFPRLFKRSVLPACGVTATNAVKSAFRSLLRPARIVAALLFLDVMYFTRESMNFGDPCKIAADVRLKLASSTRKGLTTTPAPLPKIIHQQWKTEDIPPGLFTRIRSEWKRLYPEPEYKHILWTDATMRKLIQERFAWFLETYDNYPTNIQRADSSRTLSCTPTGVSTPTLTTSPTLIFGSICRPTVLASLRVPISRTKMYKTVSCQAPSQILSGTQHLKCCKNGAAQKTFCSLLDL
jgi:hypothetical protein